MPKAVSQLVFLAAFRSFISASKTGRRLTASKKRLTPGSVEQYYCVERLIVEWEEKTGQPIRILLMKKQSLSLIAREKAYWARFYRSFCHFLYKDKGHFDNYVATIWKVIRAFFNYLLKDRSLPVGSFHSQFRVQAQASVPVVLDPGQLQYLIHDAAFDSSLPDHLRRTKDIFVFGCTVGLRFGDLMKLRKEHLVRSSYGLLIQVHTQKTGVPVKLPIPAYLEAILQRYQHRTGRYLLPRLSNTNLNKQLKQLMERAGWTHPLPKVRLLQGRPVEIRPGGRTLRFCDQVSAHTMRRTAITTLLMLGVPEQAVRRISGHAPASREFYRYIALADEYVQNHVRLAHAELEKGDTKSFYDRKPLLAGTS